MIPHGTNLLHYTVLMRLEHDYCKVDNQNGHGRFPFISSLFYKSKAISFEKKLSFTFFTHHKLHHNHFDFKTISSITENIRLSCKSASIDIKASA
jgi:hypothetical protein